MRVLPTPQQLEEFLRMIGWVPRAESFHLVQFSPREEDHTEFTVAVPKNAEVRGADQRVSEAVQTLAIVRETEPNDLAYKIAHPRSDLILPTLVNIDAHVGAVPVLSVSSLLDGLRATIAAGATMEEGADRAFDKASRESLRIAKKCQLGHSEVGSFRFRVLVPLSPVQGRMNFAERVVPVERRAVIRVARFLQAVPELTNLDPDGSIASLMAQDVSARMAESVKRTVESVPGGGLEIGVDWSISVEPPEELQGLRPIRVERQVGTVLKRYADEIRSSTRVENYELEGKVTTLKKDFNRDTYEAGREDRMVAVYERATNRQVRLITSPDVFKRLCDALKDEEIVMAEGDLVRVGKMYALNPIRSLRILGRGDEGVLISDETVNE